MTTFAYGPQEDPTLVDAVQWTDGAITPDVAWLPVPAGNLDVAAARDTAIDANGALVIQTPDGILRALPGWRIVREGARLSICSPETFARFYRAAA